MELLINMHIHCCFFDEVAIFLPIELQRVNLESCFRTWVVLFVSLSYNIGFGFIGIVVVSFQVLEIRVFKWRMYDFFI